MSLLEKMLGKLGVSYSELNEEERRTFNAWRDALSGRSLTDEDVSVFLEAEFLESVEKATNPQLPENVREFYQMEVRLIKKIKEFLATPAKERAMVEQHIQTQL